MEIKNSTITKLGENNDSFKLGKLEPTEAKLGDNKIIGRDYMVTLGLFNPHKHGILKYLTFDISKLKDNFRSLHIIKHRNGKANIAVGMYFSGIGNKFEEL